MPDQLDRLLVLGDREMGGKASREPQNVFGEVALNSQLIGTSQLPLCASPRLSVRWRLSNVRRVWCKRLCQVNHTPLSLQASYESMTRDYERLREKISVQKKGEPSEIKFYLIDISIGLTSVGVVWRGTTRVTYASLLRFVRGCQAWMTAVSRARVSCFPSVKATENNTMSRNSRSCRIKAGLDSF